MSGPWSNQQVSLIILTEEVSGFSGLFGYSPVPAENNLIFSVAATAGTDPYGNVYYSGVCTYAPSGSGGIANAITSLVAGGVEVGTNAEFAGTAGFPGLYTGGDGSDIIESSGTSAGDAPCDIILQSANSSGVPSGLITINSGQTVLISTGVPIPYPSPFVSTDDGINIVTALQSVGIFY